MSMETLATFFHPAEACCDYVFQHKKEKTQHISVGWMQSGVRKMWQYTGSRNSVVNSMFLDKIATVASKLGALLTCGTCVYGKFWQHAN